MSRALVVCLLLSGCHTLTQAPDRIEVPVPVVKPCLLESDIPPRPESRMTPGTNIERLAAGASVDLRESTIYEQQLLALLRACAEQEPAQ